MKTNKGFASLLIILAVVAVAGVSVGSYYLEKQSAQKEEILTRSSKTTDKKDNRRSAR